MSMKISGDIQLNYYNTIIHEEDIQRLDCPRRLNEALLVFYMDYLVKEEYNNLDVCCLHPQLTQAIKTSKEVNLFLDPLGVKHRKFWIICLNDTCDFTKTGGLHCSLLVYCRDEMRFYHLDSIEGTNIQLAKLISVNISKYIGKKKCEFQELRSLQQQNSYDCGIYFMCNLDNVLDQIFQKLPLSELKLIILIRVVAKRDQVKWLIIRLYKRQLENEAKKKEKHAKVSEEDRGEGGG